MLCQQLQLEKAVDADLPENVTATLRKGEQDIAIVQNFNRHPVEIPLNAPMIDWETGESVSTIRLPQYGVGLYRK